MRPDISNLATVAGVWILFIALIVVVVIVIRKIVRHVRQRDADRKELLNLMREQNVTRRGQRTSSSQQAKTRP